MGLDHARLVISRAGVATAERCSPTRKAPTDCQGVPDSDRERRTDGRPETTVHPFHRAVPSPP